jgi:hypothetical protein
MKIGYRKTPPLCATHDNSGWRRRFDEVQPGYRQSWITPKTHTGVSVISFIACEACIKVYAHLRFTLEELNGNARIRSDLFACSGK